MSDVNRGQFYNNPDQAIKYSEMVKHAGKLKSKEGNFLDNNVSLNISQEDTDMYFAYKFAIQGKTMRETRLQLIGNSSNNVVLEDNLKMLSKEFFPVTGYLDRIIDANNDYYKGFKHPALEKDNPWLIDKNSDNVMTNEFGSILGYNSRIELIAKNMLWTNRATKELDVVRRHIIESKVGDKRKCRGLGNKFEKIIETILQDTSEYSGQPLNSDFLSKYASCFHGDYNKSALKREKSYIRVKNILRNMSEDITMDEVFKYLSLSNTESMLYQMKTRFIELAIKEIGELKKSKKLNGVKACKTTDKNPKSETYNTVLQIIIPGYNAPFTVHANDTHLVDLATKYNVNYENKDMHNPCMASCVYKYNNTQIEQINELSRTSIPNTRIRGYTGYSLDRCTVNNSYER